MKRESMSALSTSCAWRAALHATTSTISHGSARSTVLFYVTSIPYRYGPGPCRARLILCMVFGHAAWVVADEASAVVGRRRPPYPWLALLPVGAAYVTLLASTSLSQFRFPSPWSVPLFDGPFAMVSIGVAYLCLERHRLRRDARSAWLGITLWITALLAVAHIATQPEPPAPYFFPLTYLGGFIALGLAAHAEGRELRSNDRQRAIAAGAGASLALLVVLTVVSAQTALPSLVARSGQLTPFALWSMGLVLGGAALWAIDAARRHCVRRASDGFSRLFLVAGIVWGFAVLG